MNNAVVIALDVGQRRIGVATASTAAKIPSPYTTIDRQKTPDVLGWVSQFVASQPVETVVVGLPRGMDGQETGQTASARDFARELEKSIDVPVVMQDEAATSIDAEARLKNRGKPYQKSDIDAEAATIILQDYLNQYERSRA